MQDGRGADGIRRHAAVGMARREDRAVVADSFLRQDLKGPFLALSDGEAGGAEDLDLAADDVFEPGVGAVDILPELLRGLLPDHAVAGGMVADLVFLGDPPDKVRVGPGDPADDEEGGRAARVLEDAEDALDVLVDAHLIPVPSRLVALFAVVEMVEPLLYVEGQDVHFPKALSSFSL